MSTAATEAIKAPVGTGTGNFVWYELRTTDLDGALAFYTHVVGWETAGSGNPTGIRYDLLNVAGTGIAGAMELLPEMLAARMRPAWIGFIGVDNVDAYAEKLQQAGGKLFCPPGDIPSVGRWAEVGDPQGCHFQLFKGSLDQAPAQPAFGTPGTIGWHELHAVDGPAAWSFYSTLFGWKEDYVMDMGPNGKYQVFTHGGPQIGAVLGPMSPEDPVPYWLYYFNVDSIDAAIARVREKNGQILMGPQEVPGNLWIAQAMDPQGAVFALVAPSK